MRSLCFPSYRCTGDAIPWHWHEEFEVIYIADGTLKLQTPGMEHFLNKGDLVTINGNVLHSIVGHPMENCNPSCFPHF